MVAGLAPIFGEAGFAGLPAETNGAAHPDRIMRLTSPTQQPKAENVK